MIFTQFIKIALLHILAVTSPGPDFILVLNNSIKKGKRSGIFTSFGIGLGILWHTLLAIFGFAVLVRSNKNIFLTIKILGAFYLIYLGVKSIISKPIIEDDILVNKEYFEKGNIIKGFLVNALNPKATLFFLLIYTTMVDESTPLKWQLAYGIYMSLATICWFIIVTLFFSNDKIRKQFFKLGHWFDKIMGVNLIILAIFILIKK